MNRTPNLRIETLERREMFCLNCVVDQWINHGMPNDFMDASLPPFVATAQHARDSEIAARLTNEGTTPAPEPTVDRFEHDTGDATSRRLQPLAVAALDSLFAHLEQGAEYDAAQGFNLGVVLEKVSNR